MKIATIINPLKSLQANIILDQTPFKYDVSSVSDNKRFIPSQEFFDFCVDLLGDKFGKKENCYVICLDIDNEDTLINPISLVLSNFVENIDKDFKENDSME